MCVCARARINLCFNELSRLCGDIVSLRSSPYKNTKIYRTGTLLSVRVLLNLLNEFGKSDKLRELSCILSLFSNECNKSNNTLLKLLDYIYHMTLKLVFVVQFFGVKTSTCCQIYASLL